MKEKILEAASELFVEKGFDKTSYNDIMKKIEISKGGIYHYFSSKEDLMYQTVDFLIQRSIKEFKDSVNYECDEISKLYKIMNLAKNQEKKTEFKFDCKFEVASLKRSRELTIMYISEVLSDGIKNDVFMKDININVNSKIIYLLFNEFSGMDEKDRDCYENIVYSYLKNEILKEKDE